MKKIIIILLFVLFTATLVFGQGQQCEKPEGPAGDAPDDNGSFSSGVLSFQNLGAGSLHILAFGNKDEARGLFSNYVKNIFSVIPGGSLKPNLLIVPSAAFMGRENDSTLKLTLDNYVKEGGTILIFSQQYGTDFEKLVPVPEGESLKAYGWREDQSCFWGSTFFKERHPALSSLMKEKVDAGIDGYFSSYPSNSTILLRRAYNKEPVLLYYQYGKGFVILSTLFTDYGLAHSQTSEAELRLVRDLVTFGRNPALPIPGWDLTQDSTPTIGFDPIFKNTSDEPATLIKIKVMSPDRSRVFLEREEAVSLAPDAETTLHLEFEFPELQWYDNVHCLGIGHTDYELYDADGNLVQWSTEADSGRFSVYKVTVPYDTPSTSFLKWITVKDEQVYSFQNIEFTAHFKNNTSEIQSVDIDEPLISLGHGAFLDAYKLAPIHLTVPANSQVDHDFIIPASYFFENNSVTFRLQYNEPDGTLRQIGNAKYIFVKKSYPISNISIQNQGVIKLGETINYSVKIKKDLDYEMGPTSIKILAVNKSSGAQETLLETTHDFSAQDEFTYTGSYLPVKPLLNSQYRIKLDMSNSFFGNHDIDRGFAIVPSDMVISNPKLIGAVHFDDLDWFRLGDTYKATFKIKNTGPFDIKEGRYTIQLRRRKPLGWITVYTKTVDEIEFAINEEKSFEEEFVFDSKTMGSGQFILWLAYTDETQGRWIYRSDEQDSCNYGFKWELALDKPQYEVGDVANFDINIGSANSELTCDFDVFYWNGITHEFGSWVTLKHESRPIVIKLEEFFHHREVFQIPVVLTLQPLLYKFTLKDSVGTSFGRSDMVNRIWPKVQMTSDVGAITAKVGEPLELKINIQGISGFTHPLPGILRVDNENGVIFHEARNISIQPNQDNLFTFTVPVPPTVDAAKYYFAINLDVDLWTLESDRIGVDIPAPAMAFTEPPASVNAGDTSPLEFTNSGGKDGNYTVQLLLRDAERKNIVDVSEKREIAAGQKTALDLQFPPDIKSGSYILYQRVHETLSNADFELRSAVSISGLEMELDSQTAKDSFFEAETISGKSEITSGSGAIENAELKAKIIRYLQIKGIEETKPGNFQWFNNSDATAAFTSGSIIYFPVSLYDEKGQSERAVGVYDFSSNSLQAFYKTEKQQGDMLFLDSQGNLWCSGYSDNLGCIWKKTGNGPWQKYTQAEGMVGGGISDIIEAPYAGGIGLWVSSANGVSVYSGESWKAFAAADGVLAAAVYALAKDDTGAVMAFTSKGVAKYNGAVFESLVTPFGNVSNWGHRIVATTSEGAWIVANNILYLFRGGIWTQWTIKDIVGNYSVVWAGNIESSSDRLWISGSYRDADTNYYEFYACRAGTTFTVYPGKTYPVISELSGVCPGSGEYFGGRFGYFQFQDGQFIHKAIGVDSDKLFGEINDLAADSQGRVWAACGKSISVFDGSRWTNFCDTKDHFAFMNMEKLAVGPDDSIYGFGNEWYKRIVKIKDGVVDFIATPTLSGLLNYRTHIVIDKNGRIWVGEDKLFYYDGAWHEFSGITYVQALIDDGAGGVWAAPAPWDYGNVYHLFHIKSDLTMDDYSEANSGLRGQFISLLLLDTSGKLWIGYGQTDLEGNHNIEKLDYFDGTQWGDCTGYEGYPEETIHDMVMDGTGRLLVVERWDPWKLHVLDGNVFSVIHEDIKFKHSLVFAKGRLFCAGGEKIYVGGEMDYQYPANFVKVNFSSGLTEEEFWQQTYPVNLASGENVNVDLLSGKTLGLGSYVLKTSLVSSNGQELGKSDYSFSVRENGLGIVMSRASAGSPQVGPGTELTFNIRIDNFSTDDYPQLTYVLKKESPDGQVEILKSEILAVNAGGNYVDSLTFNETAIGSWRLTAEIGEPLDSGELDVYSSSIAVLEVVEPQVSVELITPEFAGDAPFSLKLRLANEGKIAAQIHAVVSGSPAQIDETLTLQPGEERILSGTDTVTADKVYTLTIDGDINESLERTIRYGYAESLSFNILPVYREGNVVVEYIIANSGGLPFSETLHAEIVPLGVAEPVYTVDKKFNLYPGASPLADSFSFQLIPGVYELKYKTGRQPAIQTATINVTPAGQGILDFAPQPKYALGRTEFPYTLTNGDAVQGSIPLTMEILDAGGTPVFTESRSVFLNPTESISGAFDFDFKATGNYTLRVISSKLATSPIIAPVRILNSVEVVAAAQILTPEASMIPVRVTINNRGFADFQGTLVIEAGGKISQHVLDVSSESSFDQTLGLDVFDLPTGSHQVKASILDNAGIVIAEVSQQVTVKGADIKVIETPQNLELSAGGWIKTFIKLKNEGNQQGTALLRISAFDNLNEEREISLEPGEGVLLDDIYIDADSDIPTGNYPLRYTLSGTGVAGGLQSGNFTFKVNGVKLDVNATFDKSIYQQGETAKLTLNISSLQPVTTPLEAVVNWGEFSERREFTLESGSTSQVFEIPLTTIAEGKVFYGIYHLEGRGIYLNDLYLNVSGAVSVILDQQVYAPGSSINAIFRVSEAGALTAEAFGTSQQINIGSETTLQFPVPIDTLGGTYGIAWSFTPSTAGHEASSGSKLFDVSGLVVKVAKAELEKGKYAPGETIQGTITFESNNDVTLKLLTWTAPPLGSSLFLGEESISLPKDQQVSVLFNKPFQTTEAGTHLFYYGLYQGETLVVSGSIAFDCGDAVLLGVSTDRSEYPNGNEEVRVRVDHFGEGTANLQLFLDDVKVAERSVTLAGVGYTEILLTGAEVGGGSHRLQAIMSKDNLTSTKNSSFTYGTNLPDLQVNLADQAVDGLNYTYKIRVTNNGKTSAPASLLMFTVDDTSVQGENVGSLEPGAFQEFDFAWSGSGKAGEHKLLFAADDGGAVKEYSEGNNEYLINLSVPALFYKLEVQPTILTANMTATIYSRLINNQAETASYLLHMTLTHNASGQVVFERDKTVNLNGFAHTVETDLFETGINPAGDYTLVQALTSGDVSLSEEMLVIIETTQAISGTVELVPNAIKANLETAVNVKMNLVNAGNVALQDEPLTIDVIDKETQEQIKTESILVSLNLAEQKLYEKSLAINVETGAYLVQVKYLDKVIAEAELTAIEGLEKQKAISAKPRVLMLNLLSFPYLAPKTHLKTILQAAGVEYRDTDQILDSWVQSQRGEQTINVVFGNLLSPVLKAEIAERVFRGEGLILYCTGNLSEDGLADVAGVKVKALSFLQQEKDITVLPSVLGGGGAFTLPSKTKLWLEASAADVAFIAETKNGQKPVMTYRPYGAGKVITIAVSLEKASNQELARRLLLTAVALLNRPEVFAVSDLSRVVPIQFTLKNSLGEDKSYLVKEIIPQGVVGYGYDPKPDAGEELKWTLSIPAGSEKGVFYWAKLPNQIGTFDLKTEIYEASVGANHDSPIDQVSLQFEVTSVIVARIDEIVAELGLVPAAGADKDKINLAVRLLENARNRTGDDILSLYLDVVDCAMAGKALREVTAVDVGNLRLKVGNVLLAYARLFYDRAVAIPPLSLAPFTLRLQQ